MKIINIKELLKKDQDSLVDVQVGEGAILNEMAKLNTQLGYRYYFIHDSSKEYRKGLESRISLWEGLLAKGIETVNEYYTLMDDVLMNVSLGERGLYCTFHLDGATSRLIYDHFIGSWSGIGEWINTYISDSHSLYRGSSKYNYAFGCESISNMRSKLSQEISETLTVDEKVGILQFLIDFVTKDSQIKTVLVEDLTRMFTTMYNATAKEGSESQPNF